MTNTTYILFSDYLLSPLKNEQTKPLIQNETLVKWSGTLKCQVPLWGPALEEAQPQDCPPWFLSFLPLGLHQLLTFQHIMSLPCHRKSWARLFTLNPLQISYFQTSQVRYEIQKFLLSFQSRALPIIHRILLVLTNSSLDSPEKSGRSWERRGSS